MEQKKSIAEILFSVKEKHQNQEQPDFVADHLSPLAAALTSKKKPEPPENEAPEEKPQNPEGEGGEQEPPEGKTETNEDKPEGDKPAEGES